MSSYSHKVTTGKTLVAGTIAPEQARYRTDHLAQVHAAGCRHQSRLESVYPHDIQEAARYADDFYYVAPCAR